MGDAGLGADGEGAHAYPAWMPQLGAGQLSKDNQVSRPGPYLVAWCFPTRYCVDVLGCMDVICMSFSLFVTRINIPCEIVIGSVVKVTIGFGFFSIRVPSAGIP